MNTETRHKQWKPQAGILQVLLYLLLLGGLNAYLFSKYRLGKTDVKTISFSTNYDRYEILIYPTGSKNFGVDFSRPIHPGRDTAIYVFDINSKIRNFRIDLGNTADDAYIRNLTITYMDGTETLSLHDLKSHDVTLFKENGNFSNRISGYFELPHDRISMTELLYAELLILLVSFFAGRAMAFLYRRYISPYASRKSIPSLFVALFILMMFLPQPWFNVGFILSFAWIVKDFSQWRFFRHVAGLLFLLYFFWFLSNNVLVNTTFNPKLLETMLTCFFLPFYMACIPRENFLKFFPVAAAMVSLGLMSTSLVDFVIFHNLNYFSFDGFTKYVHPVYFSYLLLFSLVYVELDSSREFSKPLFVSLFGIALLCCGSKLMISLAVLFYIVRYFRKKWYLGMAFVLFVICCVFIFSPTRKRFQEIVNTQSFSILHENPILSKHDPRLTGLTLRLIIWQESLATFHNMGDILFGQGTDQAADKLLEEKLSERGVEAGHIKYDPHNQFITTFYKFGLIGLLLLLSVCAYVLKQAIRYRNRLLLFTLVLFVIAMLTESVLQRATGLYFFISVILFQTVFLINPSHLENSNPGDKGNS